jgi:hypothetical protein
VLLQSRERPRPARAPLRAPPAAPTATAAGRDAAPARAPSPVPAELPASPIARFLSPRPLLGSAAQLVLGNLSSNSPSGGSPAAPAAPASGGTPPAAAPTPADGAAAAPPSGAAPPLAAPTASTAGGGAAVAATAAAEVGWKLLCSDVQGLSGSLQLVTHERRLTFTSAFHKRSLSFPLKHLNWWELPPGPSEGTARVRPPGGFQGSGRTGPGAPPGQLRSLRWSQELATGDSNGAETAPSTVRHLASAGLVVDTRGEVGGGGGSARASGGSARGEAAHAWLSLCMHDGLGHRFRVLPQASW